MSRNQICAALALLALIGVACQAVPPGATNNAAAAAGPAGAANAASAAAPSPESPASAIASTPASGSEPAAADGPPRITADELAEVFAGTEVFFLDVRRPDEIETLGTVDGYTNIPIEELADRLDELPRDRPILTA